MKKALLCILFCLPSPIHAEPAAQQSQDPCEELSRLEHTQVVSVDPIYPASVLIQITDGKLHSMLFPARIRRITNGLNGIKPDVTPRYVNLIKGEEPVSGNFIVHLSAGYDIPVHVQQVAPVEKAPTYYVVLPPDEAEKHQAALVEKKRKETRRCEEKRAAEKARKPKRKAAPSRRRLAANVPKCQKKALDEARTDGFNEGHKKGLERGHKKGYEQGQDKGYEQGHQDGYEKGEKVGWKKATQDILVLRAQELLSQPGSYAPAPLLREGRDDPLSYRFRGGEWLGTFFLFVLDVKADRPLPVNPPTISDPDGTTMSTTVVYPSGADQSSITLPNRWNSLVIAVNVPADQTLQGTQLSFSTVGETSSIIVAQVPRYRLVPETEQQEKLRIWGDQVIVAPRFVGGVFWLSTGQMQFNQRELKAAGFLGGGVRVTKGVHEIVGVEGELIAGRTSEVTVDTEQRQETFARAEVGGLLRFGYKIRPVLRLTIGLLASSADSSVDLDAIMLVGGGIVIRASDHFVLGASLSSVFNFNSEVRTLEAGLHLGYSWTPKKREGE